MKPQLKPRKKPKAGGENTKKIKKKISPINAERVGYIDYKDVNLLRRFMSDRAKIRARRVSGNDVQQQRDVAKAIKLAREMALLPYATRVTAQRGKPRQNDDTEEIEKRYAATVPEVDVEVDEADAVAEVDA
jgi:small subunit ribosomal protein S18